MLLDREQIKNLIPHRKPMLLLDTVEAFTAGENLHATQTFAVENPVFEGHFPGHPVVPGVLIVEALAQASAVLVNLTQNKTAAESLFFFMTVENAKFRAPVLPGQTLHLHVHKVHQRGTVYKFEGKAVVDGKTTTEAVFSAKWAPKV